MLRRRKPPTRFCIVASRFNRQITDRLVRGALEGFDRGKVPRCRLDVRWVPGAFELPFAVWKAGASGRYRAAVAVGCILEGETPHYAYLAQATLNGLVTAGLLGGIPVTAGVVTARSWKQALARSAPRGGVNRGREAVEALWDLLAA